MENTTTEDLTGEIEVQLHHALMCAKKIDTGSPMLTYFIKMAVVELEDIKNEIVKKEDESA